MYRRFTPHRRAEEYIGQKGHEVGGLALPPAVYAGIAEAKTLRQPSPYAIQGEWVFDGRRYLDCAVTRDYIEATTHYRADERGVLRWTCPSCGRLSGQHSKVCDYA
jgi:hypothetical protein